jgi:hypothetical protein
MGTINKGRPMKIITAHQSSYLPWLGFFHKIVISDVFVILDNVQFEKNSFSNRNKLKGSNGEFWATVPVNSKGHIQKKIKDVEISENSTWRKKHLKAIESCYAKSPFFDNYISFFRECYSKEWRKLSDLTEKMLLWFLEQLKIDVEIFKMSDFQFKQKKSDLISEICHEFDADIYISGTLGKDYIDVSSFERQGIKVYFQEYKHPQYEQLYNSFTPNLSIVDLLFNYGINSRDVLCEGNIIKNDLNKLYSYDKNWRIECQN